MNTVTSVAVELFHHDGKSAGIFYCSECRAVHATQPAAEGCHGKRTCACGSEIQARYDSQCSDCRNLEWKQRSDAQEAERFRKAQKVNQGDWAGEQLFWNDTYFESIEDIIDHCECSDIPAPEYVWAAKNVGVQNATSENVYETLLDSMWEDADVDDLNGTEELEAAIEAFNEANKSVIVYLVDYSTAVILKAQVNPAQAEATQPI